ncbi:hypothetical protein [Daejeonella oryzae]|uniref:hypothetical protein n=1 Tax=Daejeonella oryzae TaxID=1122943 RepID=UPI0004010BD7|nr:hypothetical protein [Daejeonella oryzae]
MKILIFSILLFISQQVFCQTNAAIFGEWKVYEMTTSRMYKNFQTDSISIFSKEDQEKFKSEEVRIVLSQTFEMLSNGSIFIHSDNTIVFKFPGMNAEKQQFTYHPNLSVLLVGKAPKLDTIQLTQNGLLRMNLGDGSENGSVTFKRK